VTATITQTQGTEAWVGVWTSLNHPISERIPLDLSAIFPQQVLSQYQGRVIGLRIHIADGSGTFVSELEAPDGSKPWKSPNMGLPGGPVIWTFNLPTLGDIQNLNWLVKGKPPNFVVVERVELIVEVPELLPAQRAFLWSYAMLLANWDAKSGLTRDRAEFPAGDFDNVSAGGVQAAAAVMAWHLGFISETSAIDIVSGTTSAFLNLPTCRGLWPHFVTDGQITPSTEWSSLDTVIAAIALIEARQTLGLPTAEVEQILKDIDWPALILPDGSISHGYDYTCTQRLPDGWYDFGGESWLANFGYAAATGNVARMDLTPPTFNGSGFIDEIAWLLAPAPTVCNPWGMKWQDYRQQAAGCQLSYYKQDPGYDPCYAQRGLFGLSAAEVPAPWMVPCDKIYQTFGVCGEVLTNDGRGLMGRPVVVPYYAGLISALRPAEATSMWEWLETEGRFTPLNNVESLFTSELPCEQVTWNALKGSWNLGLQTLGWGRLLVEDNHPLHKAMWANDFLKRGYLTMTGGVTIDEDHFQREGERFSVNGLNYYAKDYSWNDFWLHYDTISDTIDYELDLAEALGVNTVRIFVRWNPFTTNSSNAPAVPPEALRRLRHFLGLADAHHMKVLVTLFDGMPNEGPKSIYPDPQIGRAHLDSLIPLLQDDVRILGWDVKNEPEMDYAKDANGDGPPGTPEDEETVKQWIAAMIAHLRALDSHHLITVGTGGTVGGVFHPEIVCHYVPLVNFISFHYYLPEVNFPAAKEAVRACAAGKPVLLEEFGLHTDADHPLDPHTEQDQATYYNALLALTEANHIAGRLFWTLNDFTNILPGTDPKEHHMGVLRNANVTTSENPSPVDYAEKPAAEVVRRHYDAGVRYFDLFNGWVDPNRDEPPPGWVDNYNQSGVVFRAYIPWYPPAGKWSPAYGQAEITKVARGTFPADGIAISPFIKNVDISQNILAVDVYTYVLHNAVTGTHAGLDIGVTDGVSETWLMTGIVDRRVDPQNGYDFPYEFEFGLPDSWADTKSFSVTLRLSPYNPGEDGHSASFELDEVAVRRLLGDLDGTCDVDVVDIMLVASRWLCTCGECCYEPRYDLDHDGDDDIVDIMLVAAQWGETCVP
jgi:hypothetical protein